MPLPDRTPYNAATVDPADKDAKALFAWEAHRALVYLEAYEPALADNPVWRIVRTDVEEMFAAEMRRSDDR